MQFGEGPRWIFTLKLAGVTLSLVSLLAIYLPDMPFLGRYFYPFHYQALITSEARRYGLDPLFVAAVIRQESGFRATARSPVGAVGLMQVMPATAKWASQQIGIKDFHEAKLNDPTVNVRVGCWYLSYLFRQFREPGLVLAAYNGGEGNVNYWGSLSGEHLNHAFPETQSYVTQGLKTYGRYKALYGAELARVTQERAGTARARIVK